MKIIPLNSCLRSGTALRLTSSLVKLGSSISGVKLKNKEQHGWDNVCVQCSLWCSVQPKCKCVCTGWIVLYLWALGADNFCWTALLSSEKNSGFTMGRQHSRAAIVWLKNRKHTVTYGKNTSDALMRIQSLVLTLMVTLTECMARWVQSGDHELTSFPPKDSSAWESDALPSLSKHEEHTTSFRWSTLKWKRDSKGES